MMTLMSNWAGCLWAPFRVFMRGNARVFLVTCCAVVLYGLAAKAQTTYTWNATGGGSWATAANWTPTRTTPAATDILQFTDGGTYVVTGIPATQTIRQLLVTNGTGVTLQPATTATLSINGPTLTDNLSVAAGSTLVLGGAGSLTLTLVTTASQRGNISGSLQLGTGSTFTTSGVSTTIVTVASGGNITNTNGILTSTAATLVFAAGGTYNHARNAGAIPTATWNAASNLNITGTTTTAPTPFTGTYGNLTWNCAGQGSSALGISNATTVAGNLTVQAGNFTSGTTTLGVTGTTDIAVGAVFTHASAAKTFTGDITNNGTWTETGAATFAIAGNFTNNGTVTASTGVHTFSGAGKTIGGTAAALAIPALTVTGTCTNTVPTLTVGAALAGSGTLTLGANTVLNLGGTTTITTLNCTANTPNEVAYNGTGAQTAKTATYHHLTVNKTAGTVLSLNTGTTQVNGDIRVQSGILSDNGNTLSATAGSLLQVADGAIYRTTKTANFFPANLTVGNIDFGTGGGFDYAATGSPYNLPSSPVTYGTLYISNGGVSSIRNLTADITVYSLVVNSSGLDQNGFAITGNAAGSLTLGANANLRINHASQNFPANFVPANVSLDAASRVTYSYNGPQTVSAVPAAYGDLYTLTGGTKSLTGDVNLQGVLNVGTNTVMDLQGFAMGIAGSGSVATLNGTLAADAATSTLRTTGGGSTLQSVQLPVARLANGYLSNLVAANTGTSVASLGATTQVTNLSINGGATFNLNSNTVGVSGTYVNAGTLQGATSTSTLELDGSAAQTLALGTVGGTVALRLKINNPAGVTLTGAALTGGLDFVSGLLHTSVANPLVINTTTSLGTVTGASSALYVDGPVVRRFASGTTAGTHVYPVGKSGLNSFALTAPTVSGTTDIRAEVFDAACGGTPGAGLAGLSTTRHWLATVVSGSLSATTNIQLTETGLVSTSAIGQSATQTGTYDLLGGAVSGNTLTSELTVAPTLGYFAIGDRIPLHGTVQVGPGSVDGIFTLTANGGLFQAINVRGLDGNLTANIVGDISIEDGTHALNQWAEFGGSGYTLTVQSSGPNRLISGSRVSSTVGDGLFRLNGADRTTFTGGTGSDRKLLFRNTNAGAASTFASTFTLMNDATGNRIDHCQIEGCGINLLSGVVYIGTGAATGNDDNALAHNDIRDLSNTTATPAVGIYGLGSSATVTNDNLAILDNNIYNFWLTGAAGTNTSSGIHMRTGNASWDIENNRFYQTVTRNVATGTEQHIVFLDNTSANNGGHVVKNNTIGYASAAGTGVLTYAGASTHRFTGIRMNVSSLPVSTVEGNVVTAISHTGTSGANSNYGVFSGIYLEAGNSTVLNNTIGSATVAGAIAANPGTNAAAVWGIRCITAIPSSTLIQGNTIAGITLTGGTGTANTGVTLEAISSTGGGYVIDGNTIGTAAAPLLLSSNATFNATAVRGITIAATSAYAYTISNNTITNLQTANAGSGTQVAGITVSSGAQYRVNNNTVSNLSSAAANTGTGASASVLGIGLVTSNTQACSVNGNRVFDLVNSYASTGAVSVTGIAYNGGSSAANSISGNRVHSLNNGGNTASQLLGIQVVSGSGVATVSNNMVRLGIKTDGTPVANHLVVSGVEDASTNAQKFYNNTVFIGGSTSTAVNTSTYAFRRVATSGADIIQNNIFANDRTGGTGATAYHLAYGGTAVTGLAAGNFDYNVFYSRDNEEFAPTGTPVAGGGPALRMQALRAGLPTGNNLHSGIATLAQINFMDATAPAATVNLRLNNGNCAAGAGIPVAEVPADIDAAVRASVPAIGAHESASFMPIDATYDIYTPNFSFTAIPAQSSACVPPVPITVDVAVTDVGTGTPTSGGNVPQLWWRLSTGTYAAVSGTLLGGTANNGVWRFTINPVLSAGETYQYYFVAEDQATAVNRWFSKYEAAAPVHPQVYTQTTASAAPSTFSTAANVPLVGTVNLGAGQTYTSFNAGSATGLFYDLMQRGLSGNLEVLVTSDVSENGLYYPLGVVTEYCGSNYTVTIKPDAAVNRTVSQASGGNPMINLQGCQRVVFDGSFGGSGRYLTFAGRQNMPTFYFNGVSTRATADIEIRNCTVEGNSQLTNSVGPGVINFAGLLGTGMAIRNIRIQNNIIRNRSDIAQAIATAPNILIHIGGSSATATPVKSSITISGNELFNFTRSAVWVSQNSAGAGIGDSIAITGNKVYEPLNFNTYQYPIWLEGGENSKGHRIAGNLIGGNAAPSPNITGTWVNTRTDGEIVPIYTLNGGTSIDNGTDIRSNQIGNMALTGTNYTNFVGIRNEWGYAKMENNSITAIANYGSGDPMDITANSGTIGIWSQGEDEVLIANNTVGNMRAYYTGGVLPYQYVYGIQHGSNQYHNGVDYTNFPAGKVTIRDNHVYDLSSGSLLSNVLVSPDALIGIFSFSANGTTGNEISGNTVHGLRATESWTNASNNTRVWGIGIGLGGYGSTQRGVVSGNKVYDLNNNSRATSPEVNALTIGGGSWTVSNNMVGVSNSVYPAAYPMITGIYDWMENGRTGQINNNTVCVAGTTGSGGNSSYAYLRLPDGSGSVWGANVSLRNNIFLNDRTGGGSNNIAIGNLTQGNSGDAAVGWNSDYNLLVTRNTNQVGRWVGTAAGDRTFAGWKTASGNDASSWSVGAAASSNNTQVAYADLFVDAAGGDFSINTGSQAAWLVNGKGVAGNLAVDLGGDTRETTYGLGIDIGADEFTPDAGVLPHALTATPTAGGTNTFTFAGRTVGSITWGTAGTLPSVITARYYSGDEPGTDPSPQFAGSRKADFMLQCEPTGGSGYEYTATLYYDDAQLGDYVGNESGMRMIKTLASDWTEVNATGDSLANTLGSSVTLTSFSFFSVGIPPTPLPVSLLNFEARCDGPSVKLLWATASELNNERFTIHRSADLMAWEEILTVPGAGNSNSQLAYMAYDERPLDGLAYYRLTQTDYDGTTEQFAPVGVDCEATAGNALFVYPNPAAEYFTVAVTVNENVPQATLEVMDMNGKRLFGKPVTLTAGSTEFAFTREGLPAGTYTVLLKAQNLTLKPVKLVVR